VWLAVACSPAAHPATTGDAAWDVLPAQVLGLGREVSLGESVRGIFQQCDAMTQRPHGSLSHTLVSELSGALANAAVKLGSGTTMSNDAAGEAMEYLNRVLSDLYCDDPASALPPRPSAASPADVPHALDRTASLVPPQPPGGVTAPLPLEVASTAAAAQQQDAEDSSDTEGREEVFAFETSPVRFLPSLFVCMWCSLHVVWCSLHVVWCSLHVVWCSLHVVWCSLHVVWCSLHVVWCSLHVVRRWLTPRQVRTGGDHGRGAWGPAAPRLPTQSLGLLPLDSSVEVPRVALASVPQPHVRWSSQLAHLLNVPAVAPPAHPTWPVSCEEESLPMPAETPEDIIDTIPQPDQYAAHRTTAAASHAAAAQVRVPHWMSGGLNRSSCSPHLTHAHIATGRRRSSQRWSRWRRKCGDTTTATCCFARCKSYVDWWRPAWCTWPLLPPPLPLPSPHRQPRRRRATRACGQQWRTHWRVYSRRTCRSTSATTRWPRRAATWLRHWVHPSVTRRRWRKR
jgi:hypothetical protein